MDRCINDSQLPEHEPARQDTPAYQVHASTKNDMYQLTVLLIVLDLFSHLYTVSNIFESIYKLDSRRFLYALQR